MQDREIAIYNVRVVLCTLSTLSNPSLDAKRVYNFVPVTNLVVDEASQIGIFNYMVWFRTAFLPLYHINCLQHIFARFNRLAKVCFFGDPKQCKC